MHRTTAFVSAAALVSSIAQASIIASGGDVTVIAPPPSMALGALESNTTTHAWNEVSTFTLTAPLSVNATLPGTYSSVGSLTPGVIPAGTVVSSHYLYSDPVASSAALYQGFMDFDQPVIGIIVLRSELNASDWLGAPGTIYADNVARGMEVVSNEFFFLSVSTFRVGFQFNTTSATDDIRVITLVPAPGAVGAFACASLWAARRRRGRHTV